MTTDEQRRLLFGLGLGQLVGYVLHGSPGWVFWPAMATGLNSARMASMWSATCSAAFWTLGLGCAVIPHLSA